MVIKSLTIINFRNQKKKYLEFGENLNLILGKNGMGKTSILEAIFVLSTTASHRTGVLSDLNRKGEGSFGLKAVTEDIAGLTDFEVKYVKSRGLDIKINGAKAKKCELIEKFPVVLFSPEDIEVIKGPMKNLRRLININIAQSNPSYIDSLIRYNRILRERNSCIRRLGSETLGEEEDINFKVWTDALKKEADRIRSVREDFTMKLYEAMKKEQDLLNISDKISIEYIPSCFSGQKSITSDMKFKYTTWGPHRDAFIFYMNGNKLRNCGSRGETRIAAVIYRMAVWSIIKESVNRNPVIMLDDIFSELDAEKKKKIKNYIRDAQAILTSTEMPHGINGKFDIISL
ncbi:MAG: DNA replication/repair protein RecF [Elusimicrobia bacterium]|nr:DNA replication/repair protein RecF [Elusimicrobiota bacterium]